MFVLPGIEGCAAVMAPLCRRLKLKVCVLQLGLEPRDDINSLVERLHRVIYIIYLYFLYVFVSESSEQRRCQFLLRDIFLTLLIHVSHI